MAPRPLLMTIKDMQQFFSITEEEAEAVAENIPSHGCMGRKDNYLYSSKEIKNELDSRRGE